MGAKPSFPIVPLSSERTIIVTGANTGIGYEIAKWCAMMGATVILACRSETRARESMDRMQQEFQSKKAKGVLGLTENSSLLLEFIHVDLSSFQSVLNFCEDFKRSSRPLHVLVCNAGRGFGSFQRSEDGFEMTLQVNYLSHFVILAKLLPIMNRSGPDCRILLMSSRAHISGKFDVAKINYNKDPKDFNSFNYFCRSKLYQVMQTFTMSRHLKGSNITINCMHPGIVDTGLWHDSPTCGIKCALACARIYRTIRTPYEGAITAIDLVTNPKYAGISGHYWFNSRIVRTSISAQDGRKQAALWEKTLSLINEYITEEERIFIEEGGLP